MKCDTKGLVFEKTGLAGNESRIWVAKKKSPAETPVIGAKPKRGLNNLSKTTAVLCQNGGKRGGVEKTQVTVRGTEEDLHP